MLIHGDDAYLSERALSPSIDMSVSFRADPDRPTGDERPAEREHKFYSRYGNPTVNRLAALMASLEGGEEAIMTSSGMAAINVVLFALLRPGMEVLTHREVYTETSELLDEYARFGVRTSKVNTATPASIEGSITSDTALVWLESPTNPLLSIVDLAGIAAVCKQNNVLLVVDNTVASSANQQPLGLGADIVVVSATKSTSGHSDVVAGAIVSSSRIIDRLWWPHCVQGALMQPFEAWLLLRSIRTFDLRNQAQNITALALAEMLSTHPSVLAVHYPGLPAHPGHEIARSQMEGFGSLLSFEVNGGFESAARVCQAMTVAADAPSLGSVHSLVVHPAASWMGRDYQPTEAAYVPEGLLRMSIGLEDQQDLIEDVIQALDLTGAKTEGTNRSESEGAQQ